MSFILAHTNILLQYVLLVNILFACRVDSFIIAKDAPGYSITTSRDAPISTIYSDNDQRGRGASFNSTTAPQDALTSIIHFSNSITTPQNGSELVIDFDKSNSIRGASFDSVTAPQDASISIISVIDDELWRGASINPITSSIAWLNNDNSRNGTTHICIIIIIFKSIITTTDAPISPDLNNAGDECDAVSDSITAPTDIPSIYLAAQIPFAHREDNNNNNNNNGDGTIRYGQEPSNARCQITATKDAPISSIYFGDGTIRYCNNNNNGAEHDASSPKENKRGASYPATVPSNAPKIPYIYYTHIENSCGGTSKDACHVANMPGAPSPTTAKSNAQITPSFDSVTAQQDAWISAIDFGAAIKDNPLGRGASFIMIMTPQDAQISIVHFNNAQVRRGASFNSFMPLQETPVSIVITTHDAPISIMNAVVLNTHARSQYYSSAQGSYFIWPIYLHVSR